MNTADKRTAFRCELASKGSVTIFRKVKGRVRKSQVSVSDSSSSGFGIEYSDLDIQPDELLILKKDQDEFTCEVRHVEELENGQLHAGLRILDEYADAPELKNIGSPGSAPLHSTSRFSPLIYVLLLLIATGGIGFWMYKTKPFEKNGKPQKSKVTQRTKDTRR